MNKTGILLINLGTPDRPDSRAVGDYLKEFLTDPYIIDLPWIFRWPLVHWMIAPRRAPESAKLYQKVWSNEGSPLLLHSQNLAENLQKEMGSKYLVQLGMRYGNPSILSAARFLKNSGVKKLVVVPLYPQYALATTVSSISKFKAILKELEWTPEWTAIDAFYQSSDYLKASTSVAKKHLDGKQFDFYLFSFHGLPEKQVRKTDPTKEHCLKNSDCCSKTTEANQNCYRAHCFRTAHQLANALGIPPSKYGIGFQSRFGRLPWIQPYIDQYYETLPGKGVKRLAVLTPSFVADCLETLEEIAIRGREQFIENGGEELFTVPCLNSDAEWAKGLSQLIQTF